MASRSSAQAIGFVCLSIILSSCSSDSQEALALTPECERQIANKSLREECVIASAKRAIALRAPSTTYPNYKAKFVAERNEWIVMAFDEKGPPDSHIYIQIKADGTIQGFSPN